MVVKSSSRGVQLDKKPDPRAFLALTEMVRLFLLFRGKEPGEMFPAKAASWVI